MNREGPHFGHKGQEQEQQAHEDEGIQGKPQEDVDPFFPPCPGGGAEWDGFRKRLRTCVVFCHGEGREGLPSSAVRTAEGEEAQRYSQ